MSIRTPKPRSSIATEVRPIDSFEQLDSRLRIVRLRSWVLLSVLMTTLTSFGVFSCFYKAPLKVDGRGIILDRTYDDIDPLLQVTSPSSGRLVSVAVKIGAIVKKGDLLGEVSQSELRDQIKEAEAEAQRLRDEDRQLTRLDEEEAASRLSSLEELERTLRQNLSLDRKRLNDSKRITASGRLLHKRGLLNDIDALKSEADSDAVQSSVGASEARLVEIAYERFQDAAVRKRDKLKRTLGIEATETKLGLLRDRLDRDTRIVSPYDGKIVDLMITPHALIEKGTPAALLQPLRRDEPMEATVFVPAGQGKKVSVGDEVEVSPDTVRRHEHGFVYGKVLSISEIPATELAMMAELKHKTLVASFEEQYAGQVLLSIRVRLLDVRGSEEALSEGGKRKNWLRWSSSSGASQLISTGTLCSASVVVERRPLIALAFPWVKQLFEIY